MSEGGRRVGQPRTKGYKAQGSIDKRRPGYKQIAIPFDDETFDALATRAANADMSFAELVRQYCEWGLETDRDEEAAA